jgi:hypothetical protein
MVTLENLDGFLRVMRALKMSTLIAKVWQDGKQAREARKTCIHHPSAPDPPLRRFHDSRLHVLTISTRELLPFNT